jgi:hypothetical protein
MMVATGMANQVRTVKERLEWREQFRKRPIVWSAGAMGVGFLAGYGIAMALKGDRNPCEKAIDYYPSDARSYAARPILGQESRAGSSTGGEARNGNGGMGRPGIFDRLANSTAYSKVRHEAASVGDVLIQEIGKTAKMLIVPAVINSIKNFLGVHLPPPDTRQIQGTGKRDRSTECSDIQPVLAHNQS